MEKTENQPETKIIPLYPNLKEKNFDRNPTSKYLKEILLRLDRLVEEYTGGDKTSKLYLPDSSGGQLIETQEIIYLKASGSYTELHFDSSEPVVSSANLGTYENKLSTKGFLRIGRSYIINLKKIQALKSKLSEVELVNGMVLPIPRRNYNRVKEIVEVDL